MRPPGVHRRTAPAPELAVLWTTPGLPGLEAFRARFVRHRFGRHAHEGFVLAAMEEGGEVFEHRGSRHCAPAGSLVLVEPEVAHTGEAAGHGPWSYRAFYVGRDWFQGEVPRFPQPVVSDPGLFGRIVAFHRALEGPVEPLWAETELFSLIRDLRLRHGAGASWDPPMAHEGPGVERVRAYLRAHSRDCVRLQDLAEVAGTGKFHLLRIFKRATGLTPYEFLVQVRVRRAMELLRAGHPPAFVAQETGFADQAHLSRHFKRLLGVPPGRFARAGQHRSSGALAGGPS